jgi:hypothetical protein
VHVNVYLYAHQIQEFLLLLPAGDGAPGVTPGAAESGW